MQELDIAIVAAADTQAEKRVALRVVADLNESFKGRLRIAPSLTLDEAPELILAVVWSQPEEAVRRIAQLERTGGRVLLTKTNRVPVDLSDRADVLEKLRAKERLDELIRANEASFRIVPFEQERFARVLEVELRRAADEKLGFSSAPVDLRPQLGPSYAVRPRLLEVLPDTAGHVVQLEAPYGYGKSVLAAQWAERLEAEGWRVLWLALGSDDLDLRSLTASALRVAPEMPEALVRERLWEVPTLVVVEDIAGGEDLGPVLRDLGGLVLLAGRRPIHHEALDALAATGAVTRLGSTDLAFTLAEAELLTRDRAEAATLYEETLGWALPLHVASLTGSAPDAASLVTGIRASSSDAEWDELLFLAALRHLPKSAATPDTAALVLGGFVQALGTSYRLHGIIADELLETRPDEVADVVVREADRLPLLLRGEAFERARDFERLAAVLEATDSELWRETPSTLVRWDRTVEGLESARRHWAVGAAHGRLRNFDLAIDRLSAALADRQLGADDQLRIMRELCVPLAVTDSVRAKALVERAEPLLDSADRDVVARFLGNAAIVFAHAQEPEQAIRISERALEYYREDSPYKVAVEVNLALFRWDLHGDFDHRLGVQLETLDRIGEVYPVQAIGQIRDIGMFYWWLGDWENARRYLERARDGEAVNPAIGIEARSALAYLDHDADTLSELGPKAHLFQDPYVSDIVSMYKILVDLDAGHLARARQSYETSPKQSFAACAFARVLASEGDSAAALSLLDALEPAGRVRRLYCCATRYLVSGEPDALEEFVGATTAGPRLLPGFIPLRALPDNPDLTVHYPIRDVVLSGRREAATLRHQEIPALRLTLLGEVQAHVLGDLVDLTDRQKQILALSALGLSREELAEAMWPGIEAKRQRNNLNVQLNALRKVIEPWGVATYLFEHGLRRWSSDYLDLTEAVQTGNAEAAFELYVEPFALGLDLARIEDERVRLHDAVVTLLFEAGVEEEERKSRTYLERVLELEPLHEDALRRLLEVLVRRGRRHEARQRFEAFRDRLAEEVGLDPLAETASVLDL